ncbi:autotransporter domain-containing protein [Pseudovibrio denitrificans]|nr:autotransporter domain-containing protein [Pseudovibrio denitrificans]
MSFTGLSIVLSAEYNARNWQLFAKAYHNIQLHKLMLEPLANVPYNSLEASGYSESGSSATLTAASTSQSTTFTTLGVRSMFQVLDKLHARRMVAPITKDTFVTEVALDSGLSNFTFHEAPYNGQYQDGATINSFNLKFHAMF